MLNDFKFAFRQLTKNPGFTAAAVFTLALGIGANAAVFNFVNALIFAPATYARPAEIIQVVSQDKLNSGRTRDFSYPAYLELRESHAIFSDALASTLLVVGVGEKGDTRRAAAAVVSANYFSVLGVMPVKGRAFLPEEETPGRGTQVVIVSYQFWKKHRFDPALLGSTLLMSGRHFTVVGIMPEGFTGTTALFFTEAWLPLGVYDQVANNASEEGRNSLADRTSTTLMVLGRLKPGLMASAADPALKVLAANLAADSLIDQEDQILALSPPSRFASRANDDAVAWVGALLLAMAALVLLVACLNLANMLLARGTARRKEIALRLALGGSRARIVRQLLTEGLLLALLGGAAGLLLALWSSSLLVASVSRMIPIDLVWTADPQPALLAATVGFCVLGTLAFALGPALALSRRSTWADLKAHAGEDVVRRRSRFFPRSPLVSLQIALSLALLTSAALFTRSAASARAADTGLKTEGVFLVEIDASLEGNDHQRTQDLYRRLSERFAALPGVESASLSVDVPLSGLDLERQVRRLGGEDDRQSVTTSAKWNSVGNDYFKTVGLPLLRGRPFAVTEATQAGGSPVVIVNDLLAKKLWPKGDALGQHLQLVNAEVASAPSGRSGVTEGTVSEVNPADNLEVIGIVPATRHTLFESRPDRGLYLPFVRGFQNHVFFHVRFAALPPGSDAATADLLRRVVTEVDPTLPVLSLKTFAHHLDSNIQIWIVRAGAALFSTFGGLALGLAVVGVYGVIAYSVARRTHEIGIRMALGARPAAVQRMILREGAMMLASGLTLGFLLALGIARIVSSLLYQVNALDRVAFTVAPAVLTIAVALAYWLPARRTARVDPMIALRTE